MKPSRRMADERVRLSAKRFRQVLLVVAPVLILILSAGCTDKTPPGSITGLTAVGQPGQVELNWTNPTSGHLSGIAVLRKTDTFPASATDGTTVFDGSAQTFLDTGLSNGTKYYYGVYAHNATPVYASGAQASATPTVATARADILLGVGDLVAAVGGAPALSLAQQGDLVTALGAAEAAYRAGDTCGAAGHLIEYLGLAQADRMGVATDEAEDLYNQGRMLRYDMLAGLPLKDACPGAERVGLAADAAVSAEDETQVLATASLGEPTVHSIIIEGMPVFTQLVVPGADAVIGDTGAPAVPVFRRLVAGSRDGKGNPVAPTFDFSFEVAETIKMNLYPAQQSAMDTKLPPDAFQDPPFTQNTDLYAMNEFYPQNVASLIPLGMVRDVPMYVLEIAAGQYNPATNEMKLFKNVSANVHFPGGQGFLGQDAQDGFDNASILAMSGVLNRVSAQAIFNPGAVIRFPRGAELLILTAHDFRAAADTLAAWKTTKGISTLVIEAGPGTDVPSAERIKSVIKSHYNNDLIRPSYILLLGDTNLIPTFEMAPHTSCGASTVGSDWPYAVLAATTSADTTYAPDFAVGRIPAKTLTEATNVVNKIVSYEQSPPVNAGFYSHAAIASYFQCCRADVAQPGTDQRGFIQTSEFARNVLMAHGKTVDRIYIAPGPATPARYFDGTLLPAEIGAGSGFPWNGSGANITTAYNAGRFLFIHRDHGGWDQWCDPYFDLTNIDALSNGDLQPVVFSVNCASGLFDNEQVPGVMGTAASSTLFAERMLKKSPGGAVGVLGDSRNSPTWANNALMRGYIDAIWPTAIPSFGDSTSRRRLGDILNHGKLYLMTQIGLPSGGGAPSSAEATEELHLWHCIGDPTLELWTGNPHGLITVISGSALAALLTVHYDLPGAMITATQIDPNGGTVVLGRGVIQPGADPQVLIGLLVPAVQGTPIKLSVSAENYIPVQLEIPGPTG